MAHVVPNILPENLVIQRSIPIYGITQLGLRSHPTGSSTLSFIRSDKPVFNTVVFRPCYPTQGSGRTYRFSHQESLSDLSRWSSPFSRMSRPRAGAPTWGFSDCGSMDPFRMRAPHQCTGAQGVILALHHWATVLQGPHVLIATDNTTVVAYINKQGGTHSNLLLRLVVDLFLWLQTQDITPRARHIPVCLNVNSRPVVSAKPAHHERVPSPPRSRESNIQTVWGTPVVDMFVKVHNTHLPQFICL